MGEVIEQSYNMGLSSQNGGFQNSSALQIRLDSSNIIENIELFLRGSKIIVEQQDDGQIVTRRATLGTPRANDLGIQAILNWCQLVLNPQTVQGNFAVDSPHYSSQYADYIFYLRIDLSQSILENIYEWSVSEKDLNLIVDSIMSAIEPYMTRLIGNKERESYINTITHNETNRVQEGKAGLMSIFSSNK